MKSEIISFFLHISQVLSMGANFLVKIQLIPVYWLFLTCLGSKIPRKIPFKIAMVISLWPSEVSGLIFSLKEPPFPSSPECVMSQSCVKDVGH